MYTCILILPFISSFIVGFLARWLGRSGSIIISLFVSFLTWLLSLYIFYEVMFLQSVVYIRFYKWILIAAYNVHFGLLFDPLSSSMVFVICTISGLVHLYSIGYMSHDPYISRFLSYLSLFTFFMLVLVTADNLIQLFIGWEGVGLCSYLLLISGLHA